jgi:hypothetical protein
MSTDLGNVAGRPNCRPGDQGPGLRDELLLARFYGGVANGPCVQITIDDRFVQLDAAGAKRLVDKIMFSGVLA